MFASNPRQLPRLATPATPVPGWTLLSVVAIAIQLSASVAVASISFTEVTTGIPNVYDGDVAWVDIDNDGDLDVFITGELVDGSCIARIYQNQNGLFSEGQTLPVSTCGSDGDWNDYDHDGDVDLLFTGGGPTPRGVIFRNDSGTLIEAQQLCVAGTGAVSWMHFYGGPRADTLSITENGLCSMFFDGTEYVGAEADPTPVIPGDLVAADARGIGLDALAFTYEENGEARIDFIGADEDQLTPVTRSALAFGDMDNDGDQDLLTMGQQTNGTNLSSYWAIDDGDFTEFPLNHDVSNGDIAVGDVDNDGDLDVALFGEDSVQLVGEIRQNDGSSFSTGGELVRLKQSSVAWGDYDGDNDLDLIAIGLDSAGQRQTKLFRNDWFLANTPPTPPTGLNAVQTVMSVDLSWGSGSDFQTPASGLTYDLRVGSTPGGSDILSANALPDGTPLLAEMGTVAHPADLFRTINSAHIPDGDVYWTVQAVDTAFARSGFAAEQHLFLPFVTQIELGVWQIAKFAWGDIDNDGEFEVIASGIFDNQVTTAIIVDVFDVIPITSGGGEVQLGDYDNDGDLDLVIGGRVFNKSPGIGAPNSVFRNDAGVFTNAMVGIPNTTTSSANTVQWGDYDNDGDLDLLFSALGIYENQAGSFAFRGLVPPVRDYARFGDMDTDGDLDVLVGDTGDHRIYRNDGGSVFTDIAQFADPGFGKVGDWIDYDSDGDLDVVATSHGEGTPSVVYRNQSGTFVEDPTNAVALDDPFSGTPSAGDLDHDGDLDLVVASGSNMCPTGPARIFRNDQGVYTLQAEPLPAAFNRPELADHDGDGDLDLLLNAQVETQVHTRIVRNNEKSTNAAPTVPTNPTFTMLGSNLYLTWTLSNDDHTGTGMLTYNVRVGTTPGGEEILSAMADVNTGERRLSAAGNAGTLPFKKLDISGLSAPRLYWSVQAVDSAYTSSAFSTEAVVELQATAAPTPGEATAFYGASPNPFDGRTGLSFRLAGSTRVELRLYDLRGRLVRELKNQTMSAGTHTITWNGRDDAGQRVSAGSYVAKLTAGSLRETRTLTLTR